jgi:hypothetical protein
LVGLLWTTDQPVAKVSAFTGQQKKTRTNIPALGGIRTNDLRVQATKANASDFAATGTDIIICLIMLIFIVQSFEEKPTTKLEKSYAMHDTYIDKDFQKLDHSLLAKKGGNFTTNDE